MRDMKDNQFDLAIIDPPFRDNHSPTKDMRTNHYKAGYGDKKDFTFPNWKKPTKEYFNNLFRISKNQIIWGANNFLLPEHMGFVIWRKLTISEKFTMSMAEYAFISEGLGTVSKIFSYHPQRKERIHPTQKPIILYKWLLKNYAKEGDKILDTHAGSMSSVIASIEMGHPITAYEIDKDYFNAGKKRVLNYFNQGNMFREGVDIQFIDTQ